MLTTEKASNYLVDSHCHLHSLDLSQFPGGLKQVLDEADEAMVKHLLCVCIELEDIPKITSIASQYSNIYTSVGIHPNVEMEQELDASQLLSYASHPSCIAIGETGLDYYRTETKAAQEKQQYRFQQHIAAAKIAKKPLIIHTRQAALDTILYMQQEHAAEIGGVMHCFSETWEIAKAALDMNFYISFSGILTFKNATALQELAKKIPLDRILIETDAPYLAPVPFRGKQNHPALVQYVALFLSELLQIDYEKLARQTSENFFRCFRILD